MIDANPTKAFRGLGGKDRMAVEQILMEGQNRNTWFTNEQFNTIFGTTGVPPSEAAKKNAYRQYRINNDFEHILRDSSLYRDKLIRGHHLSP